MILIGLGANLPFEGHHPPATLIRALHAMDARGLCVRRVSSLYASPPKPLSGQPWFTNLVAQITTQLDPDALLAELHAIERRMSRTRKVRWAARTLDTDILDYNGRMIGRDDLCLPHPRMAQRIFVLEPLAEIPEKNSSPAPTSSPPASSATKWWVRALQMARPSVPVL